MINMAKRRGKSGNGEAQYSITQFNLDKKGKTNKIIFSSRKVKKWWVVGGGL